jgi:hypothetical protein
MDFTYKVVANNNSMPNITYSVKGLSRNAASFLANHLTQGFCEVAVICEDTGEYVIQMQYSTDFKKPTLTEIECLSVAQKILAE